MVKALDLKSNGVTRAGSNPAADVPFCGKPVIATYNLSVIIEKLVKLKKLRYLAEHPDELHIRDYKDKFFLHDSYSHKEREKLEREYEDHVKKNCKLIQEKVDRLADCRSVCEIVKFQVS